MNTSIVSNESREVRDEEFWHELHGILRPLFYDTAKDVDLVMASFPDFGKKRCRTERLARNDEFYSEVFRRVKDDVVPLGYLSSSNPTTLGLAYFEAVSENSGRLKRERFGTSIAVERDIALTAERIEALKRRIFGLEMGFLDAMGKDRLAEAQAILEAIISERAWSDLRLRAEANNWRFILAIKKKDLSLFIDSWNRAVPGADILGSLFIETLQGIAYGCLMKEILVVPSTDGLAVAFQQDHKKFADEQIEVFLKGALAELAVEMVKVGNLTVDGFKSLAVSTLEISRRLFVAANPLLDDIQIVWLS